MICRFVFLRVNRLGEAHSHFASAAALAPAQPLYAFNVGLSLMEQQETVRAAAALQAQIMKSTVATSDAQDPRIEVRGESL